MLTQEGVVFGGRGFLGRSIARVLGIAAVEADICDPVQVCAVFQERRPRYCINAAAVTGKSNIDDCEATPEKLARTMAVNGMGAASLGAQCKQAGVYLVHLSTASVYEITPAVPGGFTEEMVPCMGPERISAYALSKREGEVSVACYDALVPRFHMPISSVVHGRNLLTRLHGYPEVDDVSNTIVAVSDLIAALRQLIEQEVRGIVHVVNPEPISNARIMELYRDLGDASHHFTVRLPTAATRTPIVLSTAKLRSLGITMRPTEEAVIDCIKRYYPR